MKPLFLVIFLFIYISADAAVVDSMSIMSSDYKLLHISNDHNAGYLYAENYQHQKILIYKSTSAYPPETTFSSEQLDDTDILEIMFNCNKNSYTTCTRYLNRRTSELSPIYTDMIDYNPKNDIIAYYLQDKNLVMISRAFTTCKKPLTYPLKIQQDSEFGVKTQFLPSGDLQLDYTAPHWKDDIKIIHPNYKKLFNDCGGAG